DQCRAAVGGQLCGRRTAQRDRADGAVRRGGGRPPASGGPQRRDVGGGGERGGVRGGRARQTRLPRTTPKGRIGRVASRRRYARRRPRTGDTQDTWISSSSSANAGAYCLSSPTST